MLQRGVLWGIGTYLKKAPSDIEDKTKAFLYEHLHSSDPIKRGYGIRALVNAESLAHSLIPENLLKDESKIQIYEGWNFKFVRILEMMKFFNF